MRALPIIERPTALRQRGQTLPISLPPRGLSRQLDAADWQQAVEDGHRFVIQWGKQAEALGWAPADLFGLHTPPDRPAPNYRRLSRYDQTGLVWLLRGRPVIALTQTAAT